MYVPSHFAAAAAQVTELLVGSPVADLVTATASGGLLATFLPVLYQPEAGERGSIIGHVARGNEQWRTPVSGEALIILHGPNAYISPSWYASKAEHGRVVPTWDYVTAHVYGRLVVHDDPVWVESLVRSLTNRHERDRERPWSVDDAPGPFIAAQLKGIVGVEVMISRVQVMAKWSQNRPEADVDGVIAGLDASGQDEAAAAVREAAAGAVREAAAAAVREARRP